MSHQQPAQTTNNISTRKKRRGMIEKKRRDKINNSLSELRRLVPAAYEKQGSAKLEKAEILQLTVDYLKVLHARGLASDSIGVKRDQVATTTTTTFPVAANLTSVQYQQPHQLNPIQPIPTGVETDLVSPTTPSNNRQPQQHQQSPLKHQQPQTHQEQGSHNFSSQGNSVESSSGGSHLDQPPSATSPVSASPTGSLNSSPNVSSSHVASAAAALVANFQPHQQQHHHPHYASHHHLNAYNYHSMSAAHHHPAHHHHHHPNVHHHHQLATPTSDQVTAAAAVNPYYPTAVAYHDLSSASKWNSVTGNDHHSVQAAAAAAATNGHDSKLWYN